MTQEMPERYSDAINRALEMFRELIDLRVSVAKRELIYRDLIQEMSPQQREWYMLTLNKLLGGIDPVRPEQ